MFGIIQPTSLCVCVFSTCFSLSQKWRVYPFDPDGTSQRDSCCKRFRRCSKVASPNSKPRKPAAEGPNHNPPPHDSNQTGATLEVTQNKTTSNTLW